MLLLGNALFTTLIAPRIGRFIEDWGERRSIIVEHAGLMAVFAAYAIVQDPDIAAALYMLDNAFFSMSIAHRTYFQKIGDPDDMAPTAGVAFSINHIAAVFIPIPLGLLWDTHYTWVFWIGVAIAGVGLALSFLVPRNPARAAKSPGARRRSRPRFRWVDNLPAARDYFLLWCSVPIAVVIVTPEAMNRVVRKPSLVSVPCSTCRRPSKL